MRTKTTSLEEDVVTLFDRAYREQDLQVAEYLLQALEVMAERSGDDTQVEAAYLRLGQPER